MPQTVPVSGINPYATFNGMNGLPHWSTLMDPTSMGRYYGSPSNYGYAPTPFSSLGQMQNPVQVGSVYNPNTGMQVGVTSMSGFTNTLNISGATSSSYGYPGGSGFVSKSTFPSNNFNTDYFNTASSLRNSQPINSAATSVQQSFRNNTLTADAMDSSRLTFNLTNTARAEFSAGQLQKALESYNLALPISLAANDKVGEAVAHASIAQTYLAMGEGRQALEHFNQALEVSREARDVKLETMAMRGVGAAYLATGETEAAVAAYQQARSLVAGDAGTEAEILASLGWVYQSSGELQRALAYYQEALGLIGEVGNREAELKIRLGIGMLYHSLGESNKSLDQYRAAINISNTQAEIGSILINAGDVYLSNRVTNKALECYNRALLLMRDSGNKIGEAGALSSIGRTLLLKGLTQTPVDYYAHALKLMREEGNRAGEAGALAGIGEAYFWAGLRGYPMTSPKTPVEKIDSGKGESFVTIKGSIHYGLPSSDFPKAMKEALRYYEKALAIMTSLRNRVGQVGILTNIGLTYDSWDKPHDALAAYHKAIDGLEDLRTAARLEEFRTGLAQQAAIVYQRAILLHLRLGQDKEAFDLSERARARSFLDQIGNARLDIRRGEDSQAIAQEQALRQRLAALEGQLAQELAQPISQLKNEAIQALETRLTAGRQEYEDLLTRFKASNPKYSSLISVETLNLEQVQRRLAPDVTLVSYFVTPETTLAFVVTRDSLSVSKLPVQERQLISAISSFRDFASLDQPAPGLKELHKWLIAPLKSHLKTPLVGIIPHGVLHALPFGALADGKRYLTDEYTIFHLPSASTLPFVQRQRPIEDRPALVLGYGKGEGQRFLPYAEEEAEAIARIYKTQPRTGKDASKAVLQAEAPGAGILHLATHYRPNAGHPLFSQLLMAAGEKGSESLELHEVYGLNLSNTSLVVISACQTQVGALSRGDDIVALNRAFMYAGAPTTIASLWSVDDKSTVELMTSLYTHLREGMGKASALRAAQAETRARHPHPYYWAGFVLTGNPE
jgi:CHAT domain-containing protein